MDPSIMWRSDNSLTFKKTKKPDSKVLDIKAIFYPICFEKLLPLFKDSLQPRCFEILPSEFLVVLSKPNILSNLRG